MPKPIKKKISPRLKHFFAQPIPPPLPKLWLSAGILYLFPAVSCAPTPPQNQLFVTHSFPEEQGVLAADGQIKLYLSGHLDPLVRSYGELSLGREARNVAFSVGYDLVDRALVVIPDLDLQVGQVYQLAWQPQDVFSADGRELLAPFALEFVAGSPTGRGAVDPLADHTAPPTALFERRCGCHQMGQASPHLSPEHLIGRPSSRQPERLLVEPGAPRRSLLVLKILEDWPGLPGDPMPPSGPLSAEEQRQIIAWVELLGAH